jgi:hypothetical protein
MKREVYGWRLPASLKRELEAAAHADGIGLAELLERIARDWLRARAAGGGADERDQARIKAAAMRVVGSLRSGDPKRAERASEPVRARLSRSRDD